MNQLREKSLVPAGGISWREQLFCSGEARWQCSQCGRRGRHEASPQRMKLWICWSTDPQRKEKLSCCSWPFSHSCATCQSVSELLLRSQAAEQSFHCQLGVWVVWPFITNTKGLPWLGKWGVSLSCSARAWRGPTSVLDSCCPRGKGSGRGLWLPLLAPMLPESLLPEGRSTPQTQSLTAHSDLRH